MPPEGYTAITIDDDTYERIERVKSQYDCDSYAAAVEAAATIALEADATPFVDLLAR